MPSCEDTRCGNYEQCVMIGNAPTCTCMPGFEETEQGCSPSQHGKNLSYNLWKNVNNGNNDDIFLLIKQLYFFTAPCNEEDNCSQYGLCISDGNKKKHVCVCMPGYVGE